MGDLGQRQISDLQQVIGLQRQAIANNNRLATGGGGRVPTVSGAPPGGGRGIFGRSGFSPNASLPDRAQYRAVNFLEQSLGEAILQPDIARTRFRRLDLSPETQALAEQLAQQ